MSVETTYTNARANFVKIWDKVIDDNEVVIIKRRGSEPVALISASELSSLTETAHLLRSPKNAERLLKALKRAEAETVSPSNLEKLAEYIDKE